MKNKDSYKIGKVKKYDEFSGEIVTADEVYYFTKNDIEGIIGTQDIVKFKGKTENVFPQAYYVKKISYTDIKSRKTGK